MTFDLDLWRTDLKINRDHLLIKDYLPTKFEASGAKRSWVISCTRLRETDILTNRQMDRPTCATHINMLINMSLTTGLYFVNIGIGCFKGLCIAFWTHHFSHFQLGSRIFQISGIMAAKPRLELLTPCSTSKELNYYTTTAGSTSTSKEETFVCPGLFITYKIDGTF